MNTVPLDIDRLLRCGFLARVEYSPTIPSTNDRALQCAAEGSVMPLLVVAEQQTAGRGRGTNRWWTGEGSLAFSLLTDAATVAAEPGRPSLAALATAVAIVEVVAPLAPDKKLGICWPNDVYAANRKLAGILTEALPDRRHVIGVGLNVNNLPNEAPPELRATATFLRTMCGREFDRTEVLLGILDRLDANFRLLRENPASITCAADALCLQHGTTLTLEIGERTVIGLCAGIGDDGALVLDTAHGRQRFFSGTLRKPVAR